MSLPIDRTTLLLAAGNQVPYQVASATKNINFLTVVANTIDELNAKVDAHASSVLLPHTDGSVSTAKIADAAVTTPKLAPQAVTSSRIANGAVGATQLDPTLLTNYGDIAVQAEFDRRGLSVLKYGAVGDGVHDDTAAIQSALDAAPLGWTVILPYGTYRTTTTLYVRKEIKIDATQSILYCDHSVTGILVQRPGGVLGFNTSEQVYIDISITRSGTYTSSTAAIALRIVDCFRGVFKSNQIFTHGIGILLEGLTSGTTYCQFYLGIMKDCYVGIKTKTTTPGYVTENTFIGGQGGSGNVSSSVNAYAHIWMDASGSGIQDNNHFYAFAMEGFHQHGVIVDGDSIGNTFHGCRFEMPFATYYVKLTTGSQSNSFQDCYGLVDGLKNGKFFDAGSYNRISGGNNVTACKVEYSDQRVYAYITPGFQKPTGYNAGITVLTPGVNTTFIQNVTTATFVIDLASGDHIECNFAVGLTVTGITFSNPRPLGTKLTFSFLQAGSGGNSITGFPAIFLGQMSFAPVQRSNGRDIYHVTTGTVANETYAQSQYRN